jgi:hypothetical protein
VLRAVANGISLTSAERSRRPLIRFLAGEVECDTVSRRKGGSDLSGHSSPWSLFCEDSSVVMGIFVS